MKLAEIRKIHPGWVHALEERVKADGMNRGIWRDEAGELVAAPMWWLHNQGITPLARVEGGWR